MTEFKKCIDCGKEYPASFYNKNIGNRCLSCSKIMADKHTSILKEDIEDRLNDGYYSQSILLNKKRKLLICEQCGVEFFIKDARSKSSICSICRFKNFKCIDCGKKLFKSITKRCWDCYLKFLDKRRNKCIDCGKFILPEGKRCYSCSRINKANRCRCGEIINRKNKSCKDCIEADKSRCIDCGNVIRRGLKRCGVCYKIKTKANRCLDRGIKISKKSKRCITCSRAKRKIKENKNNCPDCGIKISRHTKRCLSCAAKNCHLRRKQKKEFKND